MESSAMLRGKQQDCPGQGFRRAANSHYCGCRQHRSEWREGEVSSNSREDRYVNGILNNTN